MSFVQVVDPLADPRWLALVSRHPSATLFHSPGWLRALRDTYGFEPFVLTTTDSGQLENGLVACRVQTWWTRRLVSLPFSDHCDPLVPTESDADVLYDGLHRHIQEGQWRSAEARPLSVACQWSTAVSYAYHELDLMRPLDRIFAGFHASNTRRAIRRAEREALAYESGRSDALIATFFGLLRLTRRRHGVPPQPIAWFRALARSCAEAFTVHVARKAGQAIAAIVTLRFARTLVYKYGGSDARHHALGGMPFLFWRVIQQAHADGMETLDLGRSSLDQPGLIAFKDHLGATRTTLTYHRVPSLALARSGAAGPQAPRRSDLLQRAARATLVRLPDPLFDLTGRLVYRHLG